MTEPTDDMLTVALARVFDAEGRGSLAEIAEAKLLLRALRFERSTWRGPAQCDLRLTIDRVLRGA